MSRDLVSQLSDALDDGAVDVFWACDLLFDEPNALHFWNGIGNITLDGTTYTGAGDLLGVSELRESSDIAAYGATLTLSGIPSNLISLAISEPYQGREARVKFGIDVGGTRYSITAFTGQMDQLNIDLGPDTSTISVNVESRLVDLNRARVRMFTDADQQSRFPNDRAFEFVTRLQSENLEWAAS